MCVCPHTHIHIPALFCTPCCCTHADYGDYRKDLYGRVGIFSCLRVKMSRMSSFLYISHFMFLSRSDLCE